MKEKDIKEFEKGDRCFGSTLKVNGVDYEDLKREDVISIINDMFLNNLNSNHLLKETFSECLEYLQFSLVESDSDICEQCGNWNSYYKYKDDEKSE